MRHDFPTPIASILWGRDLVTFDCFLMQVKIQALSLDVLKSFLGKSVTLILMSLTYGLIQNESNVCSLYRSILLLHQKEKCLKFLSNFQHHIMLSQLQIFKFKIQPRVFLFCLQLCSIRFYIAIYDWNVMQYTNGQTKIS